MDMLCSRCKKRNAMLFIANFENGEVKQEGICLPCAMEMKLPQVEQAMNSLGITKDDDLEAVSEQLTELFGEQMSNMDPSEMDFSGIDPSMFDPSNLDPNNFDPNTFAASPMGQQVSQFWDKIQKGFQEKWENRQKEEPKLEDEKEVFFTDMDTSGLIAPEEPPQKSTPKDRGSKKDTSRRKRKFLDNFCENLTEKAQQDRIDRIVGREEEIHRVMQILNRRSKNNPVLIGEPGVGKTAIAEGIAQRLASGNVPHRLADKELHLLDLTALVAGTQFRGQFESRMKGLINEIKEAGNIILFIDEVHNIVGAGDSEGSMNTANILKPALSRGEIQVIGATTFNEYRKYIEKDAALERRFQPVRVEEPSIDDTIDVLRGIKHYYEDFHRVKVPDHVIHDCVTYSERYITDRFLPDKAIDLLDEACSAAVLENKALAEYDALSSKLDEYAEIEASYEEDLADLSDADYQHLAEIRVEKMRVSEEMEALEPTALNQSITNEDLAGVLELWTGIPASNIQETELKRVANLEETLKSRIIGQDEAVELVAAAVRRSRVQINNRRRPASFIFVGPTGVGKTELVKALSEELFDSTDPLIRLDMSEFMEKHAVSRIIGSPPGYVGYDEAGQLTEKVRRKPYSVVLFDEIEKAHPDVMNILLQILDEGHITDAQGRKVNFENTVIVMTSNAGSSMKSTLVGFNRKDEQVAKDKSLAALKEFLRPEFLGRIDEVVTFNALEKKDYGRIAGLMLEELVSPLDHKGIKFTYGDDALEIIAEKAYGKESGARDLRRVIRKEVEDNIANLILENQETPLAVIELTVKDGELHLKATSVPHLTPSYSVSGVK